MDEELEKLAVHKAALNSLRWQDMGEEERERYRWLVRRDQEWRKANPPRDSEPKFMKPFKL